MTLVDEVRVLAGRAVDAYRGTPAEDELTSAARRLDEPLRVAIAGKTKAGKSTLLNALVGEELAPTDAGECTRIVTWYRDGLTYRVVLHPLGGEPRQVAFHRDGGALEVDLGGLSVADVDHLDVTWPSARLRELTLIDTPGIESISAEISQRTIDFLAPDDERADEADAVLYLMRHIHGGDVRFLESFHDDEFAQPSPVNAIGVLSRADEVGACRVDAMESARRIADRYRADPKLRRLCQTVVPVAGLLAATACTLAEKEFKALGHLAGAPVDDRESLLLSADRFIADDPALPLTAVEREDLLNRFGLFGIRLAIDQIGGGAATTSGGLADRLLHASGMVDLRRTLLAQFGGRAGVLKARSVLATIDRAIGRHGGPAAAQLASEVERITAGAHELVEIRVLDQVRRGAIRLRDPEVEELERLAGGGTARARLALTDDTDADAVRAAAIEALERWQARAESPMSNQAVKDTARAIVRTCEGLLAAAGPTTGGN